MQERTSYVADDIRRYQELKDKGYSNNECADEIGCTPSRCSQFKTYWMCVDDEEVSPTLHRVVMIHNSAGRRHRDFFPFDKVYSLLGLRQDRSDIDPPFGFTEPVGMAEHFRPGDQDAALEEALGGKSVESATDEELRWVRFSKFKEALER